MPNGEQFPHIPLVLVRDAPPRKQKPHDILKPWKTEENLKNRATHYGKIDSSVRRLLEEDRSLKEDRLDTGLPIIENQIALFLQIDEQRLKIDDLRKYDIEVIAELEDGLIIGCSSDVTLSSLRKKIEKFLGGSQNDVAGLYHLDEGFGWRPEQILSPDLWKRWGEILDDEILAVDIGVACLGTAPLPKKPRPEAKRSGEQFNKSLQKWKGKYDAALQSWDELQWERSNQLRSFLSAYGFEPMDEFHETATEDIARLPDSFTFRAKISGKCLRDLVLNFPFVFDVSSLEPTEILPTQSDVEGDGRTENVNLLPPRDDAPFVCVFDSGMQEDHLLLQPAVDTDRSRSWIDSPSDTADYVSPGGHGTRVAGAILYPHEVPSRGEQQAGCWLQNIRVLDDQNRMPNSLFPPKIIRDTVSDLYNGDTRTRLYNHSIASTVPCRLQKMSAWAAEIDYQSWQHDVLFVLAAGNVNRSGYGPAIKIGILDHLAAGRVYPGYLLENSCRVANPSQSLQAVTVGSIAIDEETGLWNSFSKRGEPSSFSRTGPGIWNVIKPEVVEFGGDWAFDNGDPPSLVCRPNLAPQLVRSTLHGGPSVASDGLGTSFAAPKVAHILAVIQNTFPDASTLLYRALLIQSARWPEWAATWEPHTVIRHIGYGLPDQLRATENDSFRATFISDHKLISPKQVHLFEVNIPDELRRPGDSFNIRVEITLSFKAQPRRTRRSNRGYLSTWLDWSTSKLGESSSSFMERTISMVEGEQESEVSGDGSEVEADSSIAGTVIQWTIRERSKWGGVKGFTRSAGTVQKDWTVIPSNQLSMRFYFAVIGHHGWDQSGNDKVPYALAVSFEAVDQDVEIYQSMVQVNQQISQLELETREP